MDVGPFPSDSSYQNDIADSEVGVRQGVTLIAWCHIL